MFSRGGYVSDLPKHKLYKPNPNPTSRIASTSAAPAPIRRDGILLYARDTPERKRLEKLAKELRKKDRRNDLSCGGTCACGCHLRVNRYENDYVDNLCPVHKKKFEKDSNAKKDEQVRQFHVLKQRRGGLAQPFPGQVLCAREQEYRSRNCPKYYYNDRRTYYRCGNFNGAMPDLPDPVIENFKSWFGLKKTNKPPTKWIL